MLLYILKKTLTFQNYQVSNTWASITREGNTTNECVRLHKYVQRVNHCLFEADQMITKPFASKS